MQVETLGANAQPTLTRIVLLVALSSSALRQDRHRVHSRGVIIPNAHRQAPMYRTP